jgi:hypothetical protein
MVGSGVVNILIFINENCSIAINKILCKLSVVQVDDEPLPRTHKRMKAWLIGAPVSTKPLRQVKLD